MRKTMIFTIIALLVAISVTVIVSGLNPLRKEPEEIRASMLDLVPIGTSMEDVLKVIEKNKKWRILQDGTWKPWPSSSDALTAQQKDIFIKMKSISVHIGEYRNFFKVNVSTYWEFDENLKLIDIRVTKDAESF